MEKFKVKKKHLTGEIADFPKRVVQAMVDEQVRQGNYRHIICDSWVTDWREPN